MDVVIAIILVCGFLNIIPWLLLLYARPDDRIWQKLDEDGSALALILQNFMGELAKLNDLGDSLIPQQQEFDFGAIIGQILQQKFAPTANDAYIRDTNGQFYGEGETLQNETTNDNETILNKLG
tara:strand:+ start:104 stop:475 length:372 start_codon:yes stop_codon:yes gene_type:complete